MDYIALLRKDADSDFSVDFPDFPGCVTAGTSLEEARLLAAEALALHVEGLREDGEALPAPSALDAIMAEPENRAAVAFVVPVPEGPDPSVRVNITLNRSVLHRIDAHAKAHSMSRSAFLADAALKALRHDAR